jgi:hypothetical protein
MGNIRARAKPMEVISSRLERLCRTGWFAAGFLVLVLAFFPEPACRMSLAAAGEPDTPETAATSCRFPTIRDEHRHVRTLLANAMRYIAPENAMIDAASGYPFEGWNQEPARGLYLRSFTQLTAIGQYMELLANVAAGNADTPYLARDQALAKLLHLVKSLRQDQQDPRLSSGKLLGNFLDLASGKRLGPLASEVEKHKFQAAFGRDKGEAIWKALQTKGWIVSQNNDREGAIARSATYGLGHFDGVLAPFSDTATSQRIMEILDQRVVLLVFIDNANLSGSAAKSIGALLRPGIKDRPEAAELRRELEQFLDAQRDGYARLYDAKAGQFYFGWDATKDRLFGWTDLEGKWKTGHVDYLVNEFRGPATFIVARFGFPLDAIKNLGFKMKPYSMQDGREAYVLAPWEGSAFQALGLELSFSEWDRPSWRTLLANFVDVEIDYCSRHKLPGFLSESYTGEGVEYTGLIGIPDITVSPRPRLTSAASLYTLGTAYAVAPQSVERFLAANWAIVSSLLTDHGPWEGFNASRREVIRFQTSAHTFALVLGFLGTASEDMKRYLDSHACSERLEEVFRAGEAVDLLSGETQAFAWDDPANPIRSTRENGALHVRSDRIKNAGIAFISPRSQGVNLSGGLLSLRYRSTAPLQPAIIALKPPGGPSSVAGLIPTEIFSHFVDTGEREEQIEVPLPATPGLARIKEVVITFGPDSIGHPIDLAVTTLKVAPIERREHPAAQGPADRRAGDPDQAK